MTDALNAFAAFGHDAQPSHLIIRRLTDAPDRAVRAAARATLDALINPSGSEV
ncbi:hypothetical protein YW3DRAFT_05733 [Streptomyces sp. MnatMP-M77]|uniref:hypothetical protein n=1 Tax=unclassified Streptomyces TaxID=2593676 RepID=UPI000805E106|nr:hypothetical protein [Streptomyces sp. MnatMP-M77]MYT82349.1 hypothetical protein [Streptomyces sp. SID8364]SBU96296.1 hypothetical protein YW3DRAFT_05733 [Streptomyces sp. MnatMP-M77]